MKEFFHGWRRKAGVATLGLACALFVMWVRSHIVMDFYEIHSQSREHGLESFHGYLSWTSFDETGSALRGWRTIPAKRFNAQRMLDLNGYTASNARRWVVQYVWIVLPLTLLSAYLILWKPRKRAAQGEPP